jgi:hypothetical protein
MKRIEIDFLASYDNESLLSELRRIAEVTGSGLITKAQINNVGRVSYSVVVKRFGSLRYACELAGLKSQRFMKGTDKELLAHVVDLWQQVIEKEGRTPQQQDLKAYGFPISSDTIARRFGGWRKALIRAHASITEESVLNEPSPPPENMPRKRISLSLRKRFFVLKRDHFSCVRCGTSGVGIRLEVHHRIPFAKGGSDDLLNLETLCYECNRGQSDNLA